MIKIINGRKYDTETAKMVGSWDNGYPTSDFNYCSEKLFRKKTGEFFLFGDGGAMSKYSMSCGTNNWCGSCEIIPLSEDGAKQWAEEHLDGDAYIEIFGDVEE